MTVLLWSHPDFQRLDKSKSWKWVGHHPATKSVIFMTDIFQLQNETLFSVPYFIIDVVVAKKENFIHSLPVDSVSIHISSAVM